MDHGNKTQYPAFLVQRGFAVASLDFRSSNDARFPADVYDIKAGIRFLRARALINRSHASPLLARPREATSPRSLG